MYAKTQCSIELIFTRGITLLKIVDLYQFSNMSEALLIQSFNISLLKLWQELYRDLLQCYFPYN